MNLDAQTEAGRAAELMAEAAAHIAGNNPLLGRAEVDRSQLVAIVSELRALRRKGTRGALCLGRSGLRVLKAPTADGTAPPQARVGKFRFEADARFFVFATVHVPRLCDWLEQAWAEADRAQAGLVLERRVCESCGVGHPTGDAARRCRCGAIVPPSQLQTVWRWDGRPPREDALIVDGSSIAQVLHVSDAGDTPWEWHVNTPDGMHAKGRCFDKTTAKRCAERVAGVLLRPPS